MFRTCTSLLTNARLGYRILPLRIRYANALQIKRSFSAELAADWPEAIKRFLEKERIQQPTLIQEKTLPAVMNNKDLVGIARTGSGKTLAFVIPAVMKILKERESEQSNNSPTCLVLAPTRELANQTADVFKKFRNLGIKSLVLVGGTSRLNQIERLQEMRHDVYIATPGRLQDLVDSQEVDLSHIKYLVLDEADRMLDMGFEPQIRKILNSIPKKRQTLMWSATWPEDIQDLASDFMTDYERVAVDSETLKANPNIKQIVQVVKQREKVSHLVSHLKPLQAEKSKCLIFVNTKRLADNLMHILMRERIRAISMHGDRSQRQRDEALRSFKQGHCHIMIATDVAARGLDIDDISLVVNYDLPTNIEDYIHRIGRTARHNKEGTAISLVTENDSNLVRKLIKVLNETGQEVSPELEELAEEMSIPTSRSSRQRMNRRFGFR